MKKLLIFIVLALFIGCGGGSGGGSSTSSDKYDINFVNTAEPVKVENKKVSGKIYLNKLQPIVNENTKTKFKIKNFSILPSNPKCEIADATLDNSYADIDITDKNNIPYEVEFKNNNCKSSFDIKMNIEAVITYTDVGSSTTKTFTKTYSVEIEQSAETKPEIEHLILIPSSIKISPEETSAKKVTVYAYDENYTPVQNAQIHIKPLFLDDNKTIFATVDNNYLQTDSKGSAEFKLTPVEDKSKLYGKSAVVYITADDNVATLPVEFLSPNITSKIILSENVINVSPNMSKKIEIIALDASDNPVKTTFKISKPVIGNTSYGSFDKYTPTTDESGKVEVTYTAPSTYPESDVNITVTITDKNSNVSTPLKLVFKKDSQNTNIYKLKIDKKNYSEVDSNDMLQISVVNYFDNSKYLDSSDIKEIYITAKNHYLTFDGNYSKVYTQVSNPLTVKYKTGTYSGVEEVEITAVITVDSKDINLTKSVPVTITGGAVHTVSIIYSGGKKKDDSTFTDTYTVLASDRYGNPAKKGSKIYVGVLNYLKKDNNGNFLYIKNKGSLYNDNGISVFECNETDFTNVVPQEDVLVVLASAAKLDGSYLGGWSINSILNNNMLELEGNIEKNETNLSFAIGNEKRYNSCNSNIETLIFDHTDKTYEIGDNGKTQLILTYSSYMVGKSIILYVNSQEDERVGVAIRKILYGEGISVSEMKCDNVEGNTTKTCKLDVEFTVNGDGALRNVTVYDFSWEDPTKMAGCTYTPSMLDLGCDGTATVTITAPAHTTCSLKWNKKVKYEY